MPFAPGQPAHPNAGRKRGSKVQNLTPLVRRYLNKMGVNPIQQLLELAAKAEENGQLETARKIWAQLTDMSYAKPKPLKNPIKPSSPADSNEASGEVVPTSQLLSLASPTPTPKPSGGSTT